MAFTSTPNSISRLRKFRVSRRGFSLAEVLVASAIAALLLGVIQGIFFKGTSLLEKSHTNLEAVAGAQLLLERIHADVRRIVPEDPFPESGSGPPVSFQAMKADGSIETITYSVTDGPEPDTFFVVRNGRTLIGVVIKEFSMDGVTPALSVGDPLYGVFTQLVATDGNGKAEYPLADFTAVDLRTRRRSDPYWVPNPAP